MKDKRVGHKVASHFKIFGCPIASTKECENDEMRVLLTGEAIATKKITFLLLIKELENDLNFYYTL